MSSTYWITSQFSYKNSKLTEISVSFFEGKHQKTTLSDRCLYLNNIPLDDSPMS